MEGRRRPDGAVGLGHVLAQTAKGPSRVFNLCVVEKSASSPTARCR